MGKSKVITRGRVQRAKKIFKLTVDLRWHTRKQIMPARTRTHGKRYLLALLVEYWDEVDRPIV